MRWWLVWIAVIIFFTPFASPTGAVTFAEFVEMNTLKNSYNPDVVLRSIDTLYLDGETLEMDYTWGNIGEDKVWKSTVVKNRVRVVYPTAAGYKSVMTMQQWYYRHKHLLPGEDVQQRVVLDLPGISGDQILIVFDIDFSNRVKEGLLEEKDNDHAVLVTLE